MQESKRFQRQCSVEYWVQQTLLNGTGRVVVKQTQMYICTLEEFILVDIWIHCCTSGN